MTDLPRDAIAMSLLATVVLLSTGCGGKESGSGGGGNGTTDGPILRDANLALLSDHGPTSDPLVTIAPPKGWKTLPRDSDYLIRYLGSASSNNPFPRIDITSEPATFSDPNLSKENLSDFVEHVKAELKKSGKDSSISEAPVAMIIGGRPCARYVTVGRTRSKRLAVDTQHLVTVVDGRRFDVALQVLKGDIPSSRDKSYAVFAGMKFAKGGGSSANSSADPPKEQAESSDKQEENTEAVDEATQE